jgi:hypothetical protein
MFTMHVSIASNNAKPFDQRPLEKWIGYILPDKIHGVPAVARAERNQTKVNRVSGGPLDAFIARQLASVG